MKKYTAFVQHGYAIGDVDESLPSGFHDIYVATEADLRISELEVELRLRNDCIDDMSSRIVKLKQVIRQIVATATATSHSANYCVVHRQLIGEARDALGL